MKELPNDFSLETLFTFIGTESLVTDWRRGATNENLAKTDLVTLIKCVKGHKSLCSLCSVVKTLIVSLVRRTDNESY